MRFRWTLLVTLLTMPVVCCALSGGPVDGQVSEEGTGRPIGGAIVILSWIGTWSAIAEAHTSCYHVESAITDANGRYHIPVWHEIWKGPFFAPSHMEITSYKRGYERSTDFFKTQAQRKNNDILRRFKGTTAERLVYLLSQIGKECGSRDEYMPKILPLYQALYKEAESIAATPQDRKIVGSLHYSVDVLELGSEEADKRLTKGVYDP